MKSYWHNAHDRFGDDAEPIKEASDSQKNMRTGQNIEDIERGAKDHSMFGLEDEPVLSQHRGRGKHRHQLRTPWKDRPAPQTGYDLPIEHESFYIDPITNRRVAKQAPGNSQKDDTEIPVKTFKAYRSQFVSDPNLSRTQAEDLWGWQQDEQSTAQSTEPRSGSYKYSQDLRKLKPERDNAAPVNTDSGRYDDLLRSRYRPFHDSEFDATLITSAERLSDDYDGRRDYRNAMEEAHDKFDDLKPPHQDVDEGYKSSAAEELASRLQAADKNVGMDAAPREDDTAAGPDHIFDSRIDHPTQNDSLGREEQALDFEEEMVTPEVLRQYQYSIGTVEPGHDTEATAEDLRAKYGEAEWQRCNSKEPSDPEAKSDPTIQQSNEQHIPEEHYGPYYHNEPDGVTLSAEEEISHELPPLPAEEEQDLPPLHADAESKDPEELYRYDESLRFDETIDQLPPSDKESSAEPRLCEAEEYNDTHPEERWGEDSLILENKSQAVRSSISRNDERGEREPMSLTREELSHFLDWREDPDLVKDPVQEGSDAQIKNDSSSGVTTTRDESTSSGFEAPQRLNSVYRGQGREANYLDSNTAKRLKQHSDILSRTELLESLGPLGHYDIDSSYWDRLESSAQVYEQQSHAHDEQAILAVKSAKSKAQAGDTTGQKLTGNYVRDFPEEFEKNWSQTLSSVPTEEEFFDESEAPSAGESMDGGLEGAFGRPTPYKIQPALDRHNQTDKTTAKEKDSYSQDSRELQNSYYEDCGEDTQPLLVKHYGTASGAAKDTSTAAQDTIEMADEGKTTELAGRTLTEETNSVPEKEPVLYKILAWDPTMQSINIAETSSMVPDFTSALSPADALLRLSHPTKFFPHFARLEAEGFEILSGSGDVLVFRKVRPSKPGQVEDTFKDGAQVAPQSQSATPPKPQEHVNPIDMTGRAPVAAPASANFASPTGYVKYDNLPETEASNLPPPPTPRVAYNINLRREEPVYSGPKFKTHGEQKQKLGLGKRLLVGGVWVAGISYGLGVISEYFTTGDASAPHDWDKRRK